MALSYFSIVNPVCPVLDLDLDLGAVAAVVLQADDYYPAQQHVQVLDFFLLLFNILGPSTIILICAAFLLKLFLLTIRNSTKPGSIGIAKYYTQHVGKVIMAYIIFQILLVGLTCPLGLRAQSSSSATAVSTSERAVFTVPASADVGQPLLPNINDPEAVDAQTVCPGYLATNVQTSDTGLTADLNLAGAGCSVYGNDIENLTLTVEYQDTDRLHVEIQPKYIGSENQTWFILPEELVPKPVSSGNATSDNSDFTITWTNDPSFSFTVSRKSTNDTLFTTAGSVLVYEDQFIEFVSPLPENYNLYGLGEVIHGLRLGNNLTSKSSSLPWAIKTVH